MDYGDRWWFVCSGNAVHSKESALENLISTLDCKLRGETFSIVVPHGN